MLQLLKPFYTNSKLEIVKNPKLYFIDTGLRNAVLENFSALRTDRGALYESFVFQELLKQDFTCYYWRSKSKAEVDFVIKKDGAIFPIEVKAGQGQTSRSFRSLY